MDQQNNRPQNPPKTSKLVFSPGKCWNSQVSAGFPLPIRLKCGQLRMTLCGPSQEEIGHRPTFWMNLSFHCLLSTDKALPAVSHCLKSLYPCFVFFVYWFILTLKVGLSCMSAHQEQWVYLKGVSWAIRSYVLFSYSLICFHLNGQVRLCLWLHTQLDVSFLTEVSGGACSYESTNHNAEEV